MYRLWPQILEGFDAENQTQRLYLRGGEFWLILSLDEDRSGSSSVPDVVKAVVLCR